MQEQNMTGLEPIYTGDWGIRIWIKDNTYQANTIKTIGKA